MISHFGLLEWSGTQVIAQSLNTRQQNGPKLEILQTAKMGVFSWFSWSLDFGAKMAEFPLPVLQIWRSRKQVAIQIQLINIHVSECKYCCLHLVPKFSYVRDRQNWRLHPRGGGGISVRRYFRDFFSF